MFDLGDRVIFSFVLSVTHVDLAEYVIKFDMLWILLGVGGGFGDEGVFVVFDFALNCCWLLC
jgi:hypothetical protein